MFTLAHPTDLREKCTLWFGFTVRNTKPNPSAVIVGKAKQSELQLITNNPAVSFSRLCFLPLTFVRTGCNWKRLTTAPAWSCKEQQRAMALPLERDYHHLPQIDMINAALWDSTLIRILTMHQILWPFILHSLITKLISPHYKHCLHEFGLFSYWSQHYS